MRDLSIQSYAMPAATLGGENPLAPLRGYETASATSGPPDAAAGNWVDAGREGSILPYRLQDQYDRRRTPREFKAIVLENRHLRATFLPEIGGRLWSLIHRPTNRELLFVNPVFQPTNLAVRDAWFGGGVEWNVSIIGHSPFTCAPLFAARVVGDDGAPVLRLYEWDRIRRVPFQIDCWLDDDRPFLMARVRITNPNDQTIPMYWWSNIAVPERADVRVLAPATDAYRHDYDGRLVEHRVPIYNGADVTYTTNRRSAADLYFRIPRSNRKWIAAVDGDGRGLVHASTDRLLGRKMFNWGMDAGGRHWQEFLAEPGRAYIEIQGGLAQTQGEYVPMPARAEWSWLEAYGLIEADRAKAHGDDWPAAHRSVEQVLDARLPRDWMEQQLSRTAAVADRPPVELLHHGSGWGALERRRGERAHEPAFASNALPFPDSSLGDEQQPWLELLEHGALPYQPPTQPPASLMVQPEWRAMLERAARSADAPPHWLTWYDLGVMRYRAGDRRGARDAWNASPRAEPSPWALRDLAVLAHDEHDLNAASELLLKAVRMAPDVLPLAIECATALLDADRAGDAITLIDELPPPPVRQHGRLRLLRARAALAVGDLDTVARYFEGDLDIANIREKETSLSDLWFGCHEQRVARERGVPVDDELCRLVRREFPPPMRFDFRLIPEE